MKLNKQYIVGLTGGISTGKSTAVNYIKMSGFPVIEFDKINHDLIVGDPIVKSELSAFFGQKIINKDGSVNKKKLGTIVFNDKSKLEMLNDIMHPKIYSKSVSILSEYKDESIVFIDIPLLFETKALIESFNLELNEVWVISSKEELQVSRLMIRNSIDINTAKNLIKAQMNIKVKEKLADIVIYNNSDIESLYEELRIEINNLKRRVLIYEKQ